MNSRPSITFLRDSHNFGPTSLDVSSALEDISSVESISSVEGISSVADVSSVEDISSAKYMSSVEEITSAEDKSSGLEDMVIISDISSASHLRAVEQLQKEVWGVSDLDVVPLTQLIAAKAAGGVLLGAFDGNELIGFVYGFAALEDGQLAHHSHMLAVKPALRGTNIGMRLKLAQRERVIAQGINLMSWTFDPLQSLNAHFNFAKLGVVSDAFYPDFYGTDATSFLHRTGTDRLWVKWHLSSSRVVERLASQPPPDRPTDARKLLAVSEGLEPLRQLPEQCLSSRELLIEIPKNFPAIEAESEQLAKSWRRATRWAFSLAIAAGFTVREFYKGSNRDLSGAYLLTRD